VVIGHIRPCGFILSTVPATGPLGASVSAALELAISWR
jgi:hypothetical protein